MDGNFVALRPFQYGPDPALHLLDMHQVFEMRNEINDEALLRLKFAMPLAPNTKVVECGRCGKRFTDSFGLNRHGMIRHTERRGPNIIDDPLGKIDLDDPNALMERAERLRREMRHIIPADGINAPNPDAEVDQAAAADDRLINEMHPVAWEKTAAAVKADDVKVPDVSTSAPVRSKKGA